MRIETDLDGKTVGAIERHYFHAREKHPYFCDLMCHDKTRFDSAGFMLGDCRQRLESAASVGVLCWDDVLDCEKYEALVEIGNGKYSAAIEELYDCIAVLLRVIDVLEGRQQLGNPDGRGDLCHEN